MAVGDVISVLQNSDITYQPAAGVEVMITSAGPQNDGGFGIGLYDGVNISYNYYNATTSAWENYQPKIFITNSVYLTITSSAGSRSFCGIQIK